MWSEDQLAELARQYERLGLRAGERLPMPAFEDTDKIWDVFRRAPDGSGVAGFIKALGETKP
jgi:hypothetical protein